MPVDRKIVPFGPCLSPGTCEVGTAATLREKLLVRGLLVAIKRKMFIPVF